VAQRRASHGEAGTDGLPAWARFPHVDSSREGRAFDSETESSDEARRAETERVLRELDGLPEEMRPRGRAAGAPPSPRPPEPTPANEPPLAEPPEAAAPADLWDSPDTYLEERLRIANATATELGRDLRTIAETWTRVVGNIESLETEVKHAHDEVAFIRAAARGGGAPPRRLPEAATPAPAPTSVRTPATVPRPGAPTRSPGAVAATHVPYAGFTAERYNRTIGALKARRRRLAAWTFVSAGVISLALVTVTALAKEAMPPWWLSVLPAVWMIPVPFFVLSFRGTQRVLRHNHLEVPGGPP